MDRKFTNVRELKDRAPHKKATGKKHAIKQDVHTKKIARDAKTGRFVSSGHRWEITGREGEETIVVSTSARSSEAIEAIVKKRKRALVRLAEK